MKKNILTVTVFALLAVGAITLSAFITPKQAFENNCAQSVLSDDEWTVIRKDVDYCAKNEKGDWYCVGRGDVRANEKLQLQIKVNVWRDLTLYDGEKGYNMRFWDGQRYCYVYINGI